MTILILGELLFKGHFEMKGLLFMDYKSEISKQTAFKSINLDLKIRLVGKLQKKLLKKDNK